ncbi:unnamed protein product [Protopolystoma xenopodis]|uniref:Large ribosomal subunit protein uL16m n=1 Tax=Protopolystoma xenopodis TaxID=117903 RepID=A0A3S4ZV14_9PLAT|nr:unnamed protein product [Protopolystoma xenopodis]
MSLSVCFSGFNHSAIFRLCFSNMHFVAPSRAPFITSRIFQRLYSSYIEYYPNINWIEFKDEQPVDFPPERRRLRPLPRQPTPLMHTKQIQYPRNMIDIRGPDLVNCDLKYGQYGIQALQGGELKFGHIEMLRNTINREIDENSQFAIWGIDPPWKPKTKRSAGSRMGGGKGDVHHYVTPVKAYRILVELGGHLHWRRAYHILSRVAAILPFKSRFISKEIMDMESRIEAYINKHNINPFSNTCKALAHNYAGARSLVSPWHIEWGSLDFW